MPKTIRMDQQNLNREALRMAHKFQGEVVAYLMKKGFDVKSVIPNMMGGRQIGTNLWVERKQVVVISMTNHDGLFLGVAPNGQTFGRAKGKTKIEWDWKRMADLAEATIPAAHAAFGNLPEKVA